MTVVPLVPDVPVTPSVPRVGAPGNTGSEEAADAGAFRAALTTAGAALQRAAAAESAFLHGTGGLAEMVVERTQADIVLAIASTAASRTAQSLTAILNMQV